MWAILVVILFNTPSNNYGGVATQTIGSYSTLQVCEAVSNQIRTTRTIDGIVRHKRLAIETRCVQVKESVEGKK